MTLVTFFLYQVFFALSHVVQNLTLFIFYNCFRFMLIPFLLFDYFILVKYLLSIFFFCFFFVFFLYPIIPSFIFFLSQLTTFTDGMFHSLISFSTQPVLAIFLSLTHIYFNCICSFCLVLWSTYRTLSSPFQTSWF